MRVPSYTKVLALGHKYTDPIVDGREVRIEEKIDGSQFSAIKHNGDMYYRSRNTQVYAESDNKLFKRALDWFESNRASLPEDVIFRCESLSSRKHNHLEYGRVPDCGFVLWDLEEMSGDVFLPERRKAFCLEFNIDILEPFFIGVPREPIRDFFESFLEYTSLLGGKIEGVIIKPVSFLAVPGTMKRMAVKLVSDEYKESQGASFRKSNPTKSDIIERIGAKYCNEARFRKAVQHLEEAGTLLREPKDIGPLLAELNVDLLAEYDMEIKEYLYEWAIKSIQRRAARGFPEWYKEQLMKELYERSTKN